MKTCFDFPLFFLNLFFYVSYASFVVMLMVVIVVNTISDYAPCSSRWQADSPGRWPC